MDEVIILFLSVASGLSKIDSMISAAEIPVVEAMVKRIYVRMGRTIDDEMHLKDIKHICETTHEVSEICRYLNGAAGLATVAPGTEWEDDSFNCMAEVLYGKQYNEHDENSFIFGQSCNFYWRRMSGVLFVPDDCCMTRLSPGFSPCSSLCDALSLLSSVPRLIHHLFVNTGQEANGRFTLRFFWHGDWSLVSVDSRILCSIAGNKVCAFTHGVDAANEYWMSIIEKALAKMMGSYACLGAFSLCDLLEILTAGAANVDQDLNTASMEATYNKLLLLHRQGAVLAIKSSRKSSGHFLSNYSIAQREGWVEDHAYIIHGLKTGLVKIQCPFDSKKHRNESSTDDRGILWIPLAIFHRHFDVAVSIRLYGADRFQTQFRKTYYSSLGSLSNQTWYKAPQYCLHVLTEEPAPFHISIYKPPSANRLGFVILAHDFLDCEGETMPATVLVQSAIMAVSPIDYNKSSSSCCVVLKPGKYVIVPFSETSGEHVAFTLAVRCENADQRVISFRLIGGLDLDWMDADEVRDKTIASLSAELMSKKEIEQVIIRRDQWKRGCANSESVFMNHMHAIAASMFRE